jgi:hypothetical protein
MVLANRLAARPSARAKENTMARSTFAQLSRRRIRTLALFYSTIAALGGAAACGAADESEGYGHEEDVEIGTVEQEATSTSCSRTAQCSGGSVSCNATSTTGSVECGSSSINGPHQSCDDGSSRKWVCCSASGSPMSGNVLPTSGSCANSGG